MLESVVSSHNQELKKTHARKNFNLTFDRLV